MAALEHTESPRDKRDKRDISFRVPDPGADSGAWNEGQKGHTPYRGVPIVPQASAPPPNGSLWTFESEADAELFEERAAIREYDGGQPRAVAERLAWGDVIAARARTAGPSISDTPHAPEDRAEPLKRAG